MKKRIFIFSLIFLLNLVLTFSLKKGNGEKIARNFVNLLNLGKYKDAEGMLSKMVSLSLGAQGITLKDIWEKLVEMNGEFEGISGVNKNNLGEYIQFDLLTKFKRGKITLRVVLDRDNKIAGFFLLPKSAFKNYKLPDYVDKNSFKEEDIIIGKKWKLPGKFTFPVNKKRFPVVILIHGSGPLDMDETIGKNKPFKDIAWGLASRGIGVLRYEKRTKKYPNCVKKGFTIFDETIEDVLFAIKILKKDKRVSNIFLLGHSLGATILPKIVSLTRTKIDGIILLAPTSHGFYAEIIPDQLERLAVKNGKIEKKEEKKIEKIREIISKIKKHKFKMGERVLNVPISYWYDLLKYNPILTAAKLNIPILILHGKNDFQISEVDFSNWVKRLKNKKRITIMDFEGLNHLFMKSNSTNYHTKSLNVDVKVINEMVNWIFKITRKTGSKR